MNTVFDTEEGRASVWEAMLQASQTKSLSWVHGGLVAVTVAGQTKQYPTVYEALTGCGLEPHGYPAMRKKLRETGAANLETKGREYAFKVVG